ncbi:anthranilate synthase component I family protein [Agathobaculum sp.]|uniref:anthranilate synthase component I family protein n=1 Tax=Agathobaculum sp. TaxID=2048138 RepID=UPI002A7F85D3|nr:chorismate-binding protein [Agathobaculum sp.]MDY3619384.1 chorismate-binding protein [Agathobaculum sp.]
MITPDTDTILSLSKAYPVIPVSREVYADGTTPIRLLRRLQAKSSRFFLLESVEGGEKWARYSFLGFDPVLRATCKNDRVTLEGAENRTVETKKPLDVLREVLARYHSPRIEGLPPFTGGFVGYFAYAMLEYAEPSLSIKRNGWDDFDLMLFDKVIVFDHLKQKIVLIVNMKTDNVLENYGRACAELEAMAALVSDQSTLPPLKADENPQFTCNMTEAQYADIVEKTRTHIYDGDIFQAVQSRQFTAPYESSLLSAYRVLRTTNPSPYMVFFSADGDEIMCSSPETLVRLQDGKLTTFPVAGSRPRGTTPAEDKALEEELLQDEKELSEHNMLVDLGRNDLGRVSKVGSVGVTEYMMIHRYSKIMHICSQVEGDIRKDCDALSAIEAVLPAGTLSGAPKIRAGEIIEELEPSPRGVYGGALGYLDLAGNMDTCIAIRMAARKNGAVTVQAGGGIVADSVPATEYQESANKARAVIDAIERASEVDG